MTTDQLNTLMLATLLAMAPIYAFFVWRLVRAKRRHREFRRTLLRALEQVEGTDGDGI
jgi:Flp pilus assembly protein TadB